MTDLNMQCSRKQSIPVPVADWRDLILEEAKDCEKCNAMYRLCGGYLLCREHYKKMQKQSLVHLMADGYVPDIVAETKQRSTDNQYRLLMIFLAVDFDHGRDQVEVTSKQALAKIKEIDWQNRKPWIYANIG